MAENNIQQNNDSFNFKEFLGICISKWYWILLSVLVCLGGAVFYILKTPKVYTRSATLLIKETATRRSANDLETMLAVGGVNQMNSKLSNEIIALQSPDLMKEVVNRLNLDFNYAVAGKMKKYVIYGSTLPFKVQLPDWPGVASFEVTPSRDSSYTISNICYVRGDEKVKGTRKYVAEPGEMVDTEIGRIQVVPVTSYTGQFTQTVYVTHSSIAAATRSYNSRLRAAAVDIKNNSDILNLTISDQSPQRAEDVLNTVISVYNENWVDDRNKLAISTSMFIDDRLVAIERELGNVDDDISDYKSRNVLPDVAAVSNMYMAQTSEAARQIQELENQLYTAKFIRNNLANGIGAGQLIPVSSAITNSSIVSQITLYNSTLLERNNLVAGSSEQNPLVVDLDNSLSAMRMSIMESVDEQITTLQAQINNFQRKEQAATSRLADNPNQAKYLLSVERQQKVKEALYLFLLQKREENELSQAFTAYNTRLITNPTGPVSPTSPQTSKILLIALILGLCIPIGILYLKEVFNTKLRGRKDLENLALPFMGEVPFCGSASGAKNALRKLAKGKDDFTGKFVVAHGNRDTVNEAFRILRTNLEFMTRDGNQKVIAVTSFNQGSGKSFISCNLAKTLAIKGVKVVVVDGDLRHASASKFCGSPKHGISDYLVGDVDKIDDLVVKVEGEEHLFILPVGTIPPNPSELIGDPRFGDAVNRLRELFDIVLIDCPPVDVVADAQIIAPYVDRTILVVRAGLLERSMIPNIDALYDSGRFNNLTLVLNGTESTGVYNYHYGYHYGYHSGYEYGEAVKS